jgi:hypothetical protein
MIRHYSIALISIGLALSAVTAGFARSSLADRTARAVGPISATYALEGDHISTCLVVHVNAPKTAMWGTVFEWDAGRGINPSHTAFTATLTRNTIGGHDILYHSGSVRMRGEVGGRAELLLFPGSLNSAGQAIPTSNVSIFLRVPYTTCLRWWNDR